MPALGELASRHAALHLAATALERENAILRAGSDICNREHCGHSGREASEEQA